MSITDSMAPRSLTVARSLALGLMGLLAVAVSASRAEFCEDLDAIVASAPEAFRQVRGERLSSHVDATSDTRVVWECAQGLPGVDRCEVEWLRQTYTYTVHWLRPTPEAHAEAFAAVRELLAGCGATEREISKSGKSIWLVLAGQENLDIVLAYNANRTRLSLAALGFANPDVE